MVITNWRIASPIFTLTRSSKKKVAALEVVAKQLLKDYKTKESEADAMEVERNETREENRKLKRRIEAWLLHGFGSKCCYMGLDQNQFE